MGKEWLKITIFMALLIMLSGIIMGYNYLFTRPLRVEIAEIKTGDLQDIVKMSGYIDSESSETIVSNTEGIIDGLVLKEGDKVRPGDILCTVRNPKLREKLLEMESELVASSAARRQFIKANIADLMETIHPASHIEGDVIRVNVQNGSKITPGMTLFFLADAANPRVKGRMAEADVQKVKVGQPALITGDFLSNESLQGEVSRISSYVDKEIGTYVEVICKIANPRNLPIKFGAYVNIKVITNTLSNILLVPREALIVNGEEYVYILKNGRAYLTPITIGAMGEDYVEVLSGLREGDQVATVGCLKLSSGARVTY